METRTANLIIGISGGPLGGNATNYKLALPSTWIKDMGLTPEQRQVELRFDGVSIVISRKLSFLEFLDAGRRAGHKMLLISCYSGNTLCARIAADETARNQNLPGKSHGRFLETSLWEQPKSRLGGFWVLSGRTLHPPKPGWAARIFGGHRCGQLRAIGNHPQNPGAYGGR